MKMKSIASTALALLAVTSLLAGCGGGGGSAAKGGSVLPTTPVGVTHSGFSYDAAAVAAAQPAGAANVPTLGLNLVPRLQNAQGLLTYASLVNDPHSGMYRHFLTPQQIGDQFGASRADYDAAASYFRAHHLAVDEWPQRLLLHVSGKQADVEAALGTRFGWYHNGSQTFIAPMQAPSVPANVPVIGSPDAVKDVTAAIKSVRVQPNGQGNGALYGYAPQQIAAAFDFTGAYSAGYTGAGISVGIIGTGGFSPADVPAYRAMFKIPGSGTATMIAATDADNAGNAASGFATPPPITKPCFGDPVSPTPTCNPEDGETQIDTEQVSGLAYDSAVRYYLAYNPNDGCGAIGQPCPPGAGIPLQGLGELDEEIQTAIADNRSDIVSISFGGSEQAQVGVTFNASGHGFEPLEYAALASEGVAIFAASGDAGAQECERPLYPPSADSRCVSYPSTDPSIVSVGGTNTPLNSAGRFDGPLTGWGVMTSGGFGGSGGGISAFFAQPSFQHGAAGVSGSMRNVPDLALNGDSATGVATLLYGDPSLDGKQVVSYGGTSVAAPEMAAMWALVLEACKEHAACATAGGAHPYRLGNPNALFYHIYGDSKQYASTFSDVVYGDNSQVPSCKEYRPTPAPPGQPAPTPCPTGLDNGYQSGTGYDLVTGIGVPYARELIRAVVGV